MLKIFVAESLPNAVQMFADALTGGDIAKLNAGMLAGQFKGKDLLKVAAHMKTLVDPKLMEQMLKAPEKQVTRMKNSWLEFITALNDSGLWGSIGSGLDSLTKAIKTLTPEVKRIYPMFANFFRFLWENAGTLTAVWIAFKGFGATMAVFTTAAAAGQVMTLTKAFKALAAAMLRTVVIPAAIVTAILLAVDTIQAFQEKKKGVLWDFRPQTEEGKNASLETIKRKSKVDVANSLAMARKDSGDGAIRQLGTALQGYAYSSGSDTPEQRHAMAEAIRRDISPDRMEGTNIPRFLAQIDSGFREKEALSKRSGAFQGAGGLNNNTIQITIQNTEPNVSKKWLEDTLPPILNDALGRKVQGEFSMFPNQSRGTSE